MADKLVTIAQFADSIEADLARQLLADFGINAVVAGQNAANIYTIPAIAATELQVLESQVQQAREILKSSKEPEAEEELEQEE
ncbi:MAG TPA: DUF2007 domain-containing protein [Sedimentisphaerales bacterium]|nr:DUF2007 domain-containing protein [Sedimentisphaerales bacterium]